MTHAAPFRAARAAAALCACLALAACAREEAGPADAAPPPPAAVAPPAAPPPPATASPADAPAAPSTEYDFLLLTRKGEPVVDPRIVSTDSEHPCGPIDTVRVAAMPMDDAVFAPAYVVEFDAQGREIGKWGIPVEAEVVGLDGRRLQFQAPAGRFWVAPDGTLEKIADAAPATDVRTTEGMFDCPALPTFTPSGAEQCFRVKDVGGAERRIAMEGVCS